MFFFVVVVFFLLREAHMLKIAQIHILTLTRKSVANIHKLILCHND